MAAALRAASDSELTRVITERMINSAGLVDIFDLAEAMTAPKLLGATLAGLPRSQAKALEQLQNQLPAEAQAVESLTRNFLVEKVESEYRLFPTVAENFAVITKANGGQITVEPALAAVDSGQAQDMQAATDREAGICIFEILQALTELHFDLELRYVREVGRRSVGLPDIKRLASHLRKTNDFARIVYDLADLSGLVVLANGRWQLSTQAEKWVGWSQTQRWRHLVSTWRNILGDESANELLSDIKTFAPNIPNLDSLLARNYPLADSSVQSRIHRLAKLANSIGLTVEGSATSWLNATLDGKIDEAVKLAAEMLPVAQNKIICQADLSLIAPGPLPTATEIELRRFAETEQIGMASTYRLTTLSVTHGLETGLRPEQISGLLVELSGKALPQPVDYLIREVANRFGRLTVSAASGEARSSIRAADPILLTEILNDTRLRPFNLLPGAGAGMRASAEAGLHTRFEPEVIYYGLREAGYAAIRVDEFGKVLSPRVALELNGSETTAKKASTIVDDIQRIRAQDSRVSKDPDSSDIQRQIQLALKNKTKLQITVTNAAGLEIEYLLEPIGIANGRLRALDSRADIERTLPLSSILKVSLD